MGPGATPSHLSHHSWAEMGWEAGGVCAAREPEPALPAPVAHVVPQLPPRWEMTISVCAGGAAWRKRHLKHFQMEGGWVPWRRGLYTAGLPRADFALLTLSVPSNALKDQGFPPSPPQRPEFPLWGGQGWVVLKPWAQLRSVQAVWEEAPSPNCFLGVGVELTGTLMATCVKCTLLLILPKYDGTLESLAQVPTKVGFLFYASV